MAHDDEPYTIGSSSVRYSFSHLSQRICLTRSFSLEMLMLSIPSSYRLLALIILVFLIILQVDVYDFVKKRGMFVATQRTEVTIYIQAHI